MWEYDEFAGEHDGRAAAVLADGSEPKPMLYDTGSTANFHETSDWWVYDGTRRAPLATAPPMLISRADGWCSGVRL